MAGPAVRRCGGELANAGCIDLVALVAGNGLVRALQRIGFAVPSGVDKGRQEAIWAMAFQTVGMVFEKLAAVGIGVALAALVGLARRVRVAVGIG